VVPYPSSGKRCIVISNLGITTSRREDGVLINRFPSNLPNGSNTSKGVRNNYCILDCIFQEATSTYFVLDIMTWKGYLFYDCSADFRFFWKVSKLEETNTRDITTQNPFRFIPLPYYECDSKGIKEALSGVFPIHREGLLFYSKQTHYTFGITPLVCALGVDLVISKLSQVLYSSGQ